MSVNHHNGHAPKTIMHNLNVLYCLHSLRKREQQQARWMRARHNGTHVQHTACTKERATAGNSRGVNQSYCPLQIRTAPLHFLMLPQITACRPALTRADECASLPNWVCHKANSLGFKVPDSADRKTAQHMFTNGIHVRACAPPWANPGGAPTARLRAALQWRV